METGEPPMYRVLLHNDDYTTMEFVVEVLMHGIQQIAGRGHPDHAECSSKGVGCMRGLPLEVAETKVETVHCLGAGKRSSPQMHHGKGIRYDQQRIKRNPRVCCERSQKKTS